MYDYLPILSTNKIKTKMYFSIFYCYRLLESYPCHCCGIVIIMDYEIRCPIRIKNRIVWKPNWNLNLIWEMKKGKYLNFELLITFEKNWIVYNFSYEFFFKISLFLLKNFNYITCWLNHTRINSRIQLWQRKEELRKKIIDPH